MFVPKFLRTKLVDHFIEVPMSHKNKCIHSNEHDIYHVPWQKKVYEGTHGITVIFVGSELSDPRLNPEWGCVHLMLC